MTDPYFIEKTPGPGAYNVDPASRMTSRRPPSYTLARKLESQADYEAPGPGTYNPRLEPHGPKFTFQGRPDKKGRQVEAGPGPGEYESNVTSSTRRPPAFTMQARYRGSSSSKVVPGPGAYNLRSKIDAPAFTMQGRYKGASGEDNPGPGHYSSSSSAAARSAPRITFGERHSDSSPIGTPVYSSAQSAYPLQYQRALCLVDLGNNIITGSIPDDLVDIPTLQGDIPVSLFKLSNLTKFNLAGNNFTRKIPQLMACHYGDAALSDNLFLVVEPCPLSATPSSPLPDEEEPLPGSAIPPHPVHRRSSNSLSTLTIVALTAGDIALLLMSGAGFVFFISWWKKRSKNNKDDENEDKSANCNLRSVYGKELGQAAEPHRPTYLVPAPALKPALKSVLRKVNEDDQDTEIAAENDFALSCEEVGMDPVILDRRLVLEIDSLLRANADTKLRHNEVGCET
ncbi:hypothetical protein R1sor_005591 [Riccia sorocarpa]|uniref:Uncharacterized protein n=1 Tax=Riccia sorocarpa TaxID=122646 RepID=A0ABD3HPE2_9MARC